MDFLSAKREAQERSRKEKRAIYIIVDEEGECSTSGAPLTGAIGAWKNGSENALPPVAASKQKENESKLNKKTKANPKPEIIEEQINTVMKTIKEKSASKKLVKKGAVKKPTKPANGKKRALDAPVKGGAALAILNALKKGIQTKANLAKLGKTKEANISWYLSKLKNNGHKIELTDKGYKLS